MLQQSHFVPRVVQELTLTTGQDEDRHANATASGRGRRNGGTAILSAEMRELCVVFVKLDIQLNHSAVLSQAVFACVQTVVYQFGGSVNKLIVDDKGTLVLLCFGLPPLVQPDAPIRAVAAASLLQGQLWLKFRVGAALGVTFSRCFCGTVGSDTRREYTVMGDGVNLAARLMGEAASAFGRKGGVMMDPHVALQVRSSTRDSPAFLSPFLLPRG